jgi:hypothetical protein
LLGGTTGTAARAAARIADGFYPISPAHWPKYRAECLKLGKPDPGPAGQRAPMFVHLAEDPDAARSKLTPYLLNAIREYRGWTRGQLAVPPQFAPNNDSDLRASPHYLILTPLEAVRLLQSLGPDGLCILRPMWGGFAPELGWESLRLLVEKVLPQAAESRSISADLE